LSTLKQYESGQTAPSLEVLTNMSELFDVDFKISSKNKHPLIIKKEQA